MPDQPNAAAISLTTPLGEIPRLRVDHAEALARLEIETVADLVRHLPARYERIEAEGTIAELVLGGIGTVRGEITATRLVPRGKRPRFEAVVMDHTGRLDVVWFNQTYLKDKLYPGLVVRVQGQAKRHGASVQMVNPKFEVVEAEAPASGGTEETAAERRGTQGQEAYIRPVYPASEAISSREIERVVEVVLDGALRQIEDHLPPEFRKKRSLPELREAYRMAHRPESMEEGREAVRRLAYDELLMMQLGVFLRKAQLRGSVRAPELKWTKTIDEHIRQRFPFALTGAQERVIKEIVGDLSHDEPGNRLIQGDVGSGKTVVALYAMLVAVANKQQAALMAPTELLAEQHYLSISEMLKGSSVKVELLVGALSENEKRSIHRRLESGDIDILIGTHALLTERVRFESLAVAVIDEQHRFGVHQRVSLRSKGMGLTAEDAESAEAGGGNDRLLRPSPRPRPTSAPSAPPGVNLTITPHVIVMTATPIPRTLALTLLGDLDVSTIDELPPGRTPIVTKVVEGAKSGEVYEYVRKRLDAGEQAYIVTPMIDRGASAASLGGNSEREPEEDLNDLRTVMARLENGEFKGKRIAALHGRLKRETREAVMARFRAGQIDALVATTVIEVGVDVPNATMMVVEHAERFGLAQLHQLRGRVGRGRKKSLCVLISSPPLASGGGSLTPDAEARLAAMAATTDGFEIAEKDLLLRGPGEVFGMRQAGAPPFKVADLMRDRDLLAMARRDAETWIKKSPTLHGAGEDLLRKRLLKQHGQWLGLADVG